MSTEKITWKEIDKSLEWAKVCHKGEERALKYYSISRVGLELSGDIVSDKIEVAILFGKMEYEYLLKFDKEIINKKIASIFKANPPLVILSKSFNYELIKDLAVKYDVTVFKSDLSASKINILYATDLLMKLAEERTIHGNLIQVSGMGILLLGESGLGKSEVSLELIKKGHQFISDDVVVYKRILNKILGRSHAGTKGFIEIRGLGIVNLIKIFGIRSLSDLCTIDVVVELEIYENTKTFDRLGNTNEYKDFLDIKIPYYKVPVSPGRKISDIIELLASIEKLKKTGYSGLRDFENSLKENKDKNG